MIRLWTEFGALYVLLPAALLALRLAGATVPVLPVLWAACLPAAAYLARREGWRARAFFGVPVSRRLCAALAIRVGVAAAVLSAGIALLDASLFLELPRRNVKLWALVMACYPVLSVVPQGILYRGLFFARYAVLFRGPRACALAAAAVFSLAHVVFGNVWAPLLTLAGGLLINRTYRRTGSLMASDLEHAAYGQVVFTVGWGRFLYHGTTRLLQGLAS